jgi:DNA primase small subunit
MFRLNDATRAFLKKAYKQYYFSRQDSIEFPDEIQSREFGYFPFGGTMVRHLAFRSPGEASAEILKQTPSSVYCSNARYSAPTLPMEEKGWLGAELIFDIDATDIPTACKKGHDVWYCEECHASGRLPKPPKCTRCGSGTAELKGTCKVCLDASRDHARRVLDFLTDDFGTAPGSVRVYFSGNRGYHLHVFDRRFELLDQLGRAEIADYIRGGSLPPPQTLASTIRRRPSGVQPSGAGWMKRVDSYVEERRPGYTGTLQKLVSGAVSAQRALIDASVTTDVHRVFRLAGTLHGNTGMCKKRVESLDAFDPAVDPVVLSGEPVKVNVAFYPQFSVGGGSYGPFRSAVETLPTYAAVPILARGLGEVA